MPVADSKISELPAASALTGSEEIPAVQSAATVKTTANALKTFMQLGMVMTGALIAASGSAALPSLGIGGTTSGLYPYGGGALGFSVNAVHYVRIDTGGNLLITQAASEIQINGAGFVSSFVSNTAGLSPELRGRRGRGTAIGSPAGVAQNDWLMAVAAAGYDGVSTYRTGGLMLWTVNAAAPGATNMETRTAFWACPAASATIAELARLEHATGLSMYGANVVIDQNRLHRMRVYTVGTLPAAGTAGRRAAVSDATAPAFLTALVGGGAVNCPAYDNGAAWVAG